MKTTLWKAMKDRSVNARVLAQRIGVWPEQVYGWMKRRHAPGADTAARIREALEIPADVEIDWSRKGEGNGSE